MRLFRYLLLIAVISVTGSLRGHAQEPVPTDDTTQKVHILNYTKNITFKTINDTTRITIIAGTVTLRQGNTLFYCDSCVINNNTKIFEAWGNVHINDADTADVYSNHLRYIMNKKLAYLDGNVKLTDSKAVLTTPDLEYNMETNIGIYTHGGKVINGKSVLTSQEAYYFSEFKDIYFKKNVFLQDPAYTIKTDSLLYNSVSRNARFLSYTVIKDSTGRVIKTKEGFYNQETGKAQFGLRPEINDGCTVIIGNNITLDDSVSIVEGNAIIRDTCQGTTIIAGRIIRNKATEAVLAIRKPLMIVRQGNDSIYVSADTLYTAKLSELERRQDSLAKADSVMARDLAQQKMRQLSNIAALDSARRVPYDSASTRDTSSIENRLQGQAINLNIIRDTINQGDRYLLDSVRREISAQIPVKKLPDTTNSAIVDRSTSQRSPGDKLRLDTTKATATVTQPARSVSKHTDTTRSVVASTKQRPTDSTNRKSLTQKENFSLNSGTDSTDRYFTAIGKVRIYNDSLQSVCDSMFYSFRDSTFRLYKDPVVWAEKSQVTGDTILLLTRNKKPHRFEAHDNGFMINNIDGQAFNQIKSRRIDGFFLDGNIDSVRARGYAECIYYLQDEDSAYTGINETKCDIMDIYFREKSLYKVIFRSQVTGTIWPITQKGPDEMKLQNFRWLEARRPKSRLEMFQ